jgi:hypothetical protein
MHSTLEAETEPDPSCSGRGWKARRSRRAFMIGVLARGTADTHQANVPRLQRLQTGGEPVTPNPVEPDGVRLAVAQLEALASDLSERGYETRVSRDGGTLSLGIASQSAPDSRETIVACAGDDGAWWFWWSRGDRIARITDAEAAAFKIAHVLSPQAGG